MKLSVLELENYFKEQGYLIRNDNKIELLLERDGLSVTLPFEAGQSRNITIELVCEFPTIENFIAAMQVGSINSLHQLKQSCCWKQYTAGNGSVSCFLDSLEGVEVCFRIVKETTEIYSLDMKYYDIAETAMTLPEHFIQYIQVHMHEFQQKKIRKQGLQNCKPWRYN